MTEQWRPIPGYGGQHEASSLGQIRSKDHCTTWSRKRQNGTVETVTARYRGRSIRQNLCPRGYMQVHLVSRTIGIATTVPVHVLVLEAFIGPRPDGALGRHLNDQKLDNRLENLAWGTPSENVMDAVRNGKWLVGSEAAHAKLSDEQVVEIRSLRGTMSNRAIARRFGMAHASINQIIAGKTYKDAGRGSEQ